MLLVRLRLPTCRYRRKCLSNRRSSHIRLSFDIPMWVMCEAILGNMRPRRVKHPPLAHRVCVAFLALSDRRCNRHRVSVVLLCCVYVSRVYFIAFVLPAIVLLSVVYVRGCPIYRGTMFRKDRNTLAQTRRLGRPINVIFSAHTIVGIAHDAAISPTGQELFRSVFSVYVIQSSKTLLSKN